MPEYSLQGIQALPSQGELAVSLLGKMVLVVLSTENHSVLQVSRELLHNMEETHPHTRWN